MKAQTAKLYNWATQKATSTRSPLWIALLFTMEIFLLLPLDALLAFFCLQNRSKTFLYIILAAFASTLSGAMGYLFGHFLWDVLSPYLIPHVISAATFASTSANFVKYEYWAVFIGTFLPFPLKVLALAAGAFHLGLVPFITAMILARLLRFSLYGSAMLLWGPRLKAFLDRNFHHVLLLLGAKMALAFSFFWLISK